MHFLLAFNRHRIQKDVVAYFTRRLDALGCYSVLVSSEPCLLAVELSAEEMELEATRLKLLKRTLAGGFEPFDVTARDTFQAIDSEDFFLPMERSLMADLVVRHIQVDEDFLELAGRAGWQGEDDHRVSPDDALTIASKRIGFLDYVTPVHETGKAKEIWHKTYRQVLCPIQDIRCYFGEGIAFYYAWMNHFTSWLLFPALASLLLWYLQPPGATVDSNPYTPAFALAMVLWAVLFIKFWRRSSTWWAWHWGTLEADEKEFIRPEFKGQMRTSPVTGQPERYYSENKRALKYAASALVTVLMLGAAFVVMICLLNLQGYVAKGKGSLFHIKFLDQFSKPGAIFDPEGGNFWLSLIPVMLQYASIYFLNGLYSSVATNLTNWENHRTEDAHERSLIMKRFCFEGLNNYLPLFYLAFYELDMVRVRHELIGLFSLNCLRRVATETALPLLGKLFRQQFGGRHSRMGGAAEESNVSQALHASVEEEYEQFDDYLEMVIEFGYITMFSVAFPFAAVLSLFTCLIEMKSDAFKMCFVTRRPIVYRVKGIGQWEAVLTMQVFISIITNVLVIGLSTNQMSRWLPQYFQEVEVGSGQKVHQMQDAYSDQVLALIVTVEHLLAAGMLLVMVCVSDCPYKIQVALQRQKYEAEQVLLAWKKEHRARVASSPRKRMAANAFLAKLQPHRASRAASMAPAALAAADTAASAAGAATAGGASATASAAELRRRSRQSTKDSVVAASAVLQQRAGRPAAHFRQAAEAEENDSAGSVPPRASAGLPTSAALGDRAAAGGVPRLLSGAAAIRKLQRSRSFSVAASSTGTVLGGDGAPSPPADAAAAPPAPRRASSLERWSMLKGFSQTLAAGLAPQSSAALDNSLRSLDVLERQPHDPWAEMASRPSEPRAEVPTHALLHEDETPQADQASDGDAAEDARHPELFVTTRSFTTTATKRGRRARSAQPRGASGEGGEQLIKAVRRRERPATASSQCVQAVRSGSLERSKRGAVRLTDATKTSMSRTAASRVATDGTLSGRSSPAMRASAKLSAERRPKADRMKAAQTRSAA